MRPRAKDVLLVYLLMIVLGVAVGTVVSCNNTPSSPQVDFGEGPDEGVQVTTVPTQPAEPSGPRWQSNGALVEIVFDEWGPGGCHTRGGQRRFRITNNRDVEIYSRLAAYTDDDLTCATQETVTGDPLMQGPNRIGPGETALVSYWVGIPRCGSLQVDDCWGPGTMTECVEVVRDGFKSDEVCVRPTPTPTPKPTPTPTPTPPTKKPFCHVACHSPQVSALCRTCPIERVQEIQMYTNEGVGLPPGHERHFNCRYQKPPDYWGMCDGRSRTPEAYLCQ